jgi:Rrf2 family nitric oxide-sensitive transcriptional repressor
MKLTSFTDYSLRVLIFVAAQPHRRATIAAIARAYDIVLEHFNLEHLVRSRRDMCQVACLDVAAQVTHP